MDTIWRFLVALTCLERKIMKIQRNRGAWQAEMPEIWRYESLRHPKIYPNAFLGINYVSESCLLGCGLDFTALPVQNVSQDSVGFNPTLRKSKTKQNSWKMDSNDRGLYHKQIRSHNKWFGYARDIQTAPEQKLNEN